MNNPYNNPTDERSNKMYAHLAAGKRIEALIAVNENTRANAQNKIQAAEKTIEEAEERIAELEQERVDHWAGNDAAWAEILGEEGQRG